VKGIVDMKSIVKQTKGLSGAYIEEIVRNAFVMALEDSQYDAKKAKVSQKHLESATKLMLAHRDRAKKDLAKRDLMFEDDEDDVVAVSHDASFG
jgi:SpoVK/Ycf46/Vps4 family AAA+-type ATPase